MLGPFPELLLSPGVWIVKLVGFLLRLIGPALHYKNKLFNRIYSINLELVNFALNKMSQKYKNMFQFEVECGGTA